MRKNVVMTLDDLVYKKTHKIISTLFKIVIVINPKF